MNKIKNNGWLIWLISASLIIAGLSIYWGDTAFGIISAVTGVACVVLTAKGYRAAFIVGAINTLMYATIALNSKYYGDFMLNALYYFPMQFVGWKMWTANRNITGEIRAKSMTKQQGVKLLVFALIAIAVYSFILKALGGSLPIVDSISTVLSVIAMILSVKMFKEQWILWIVINSVSIFMWIVAVKDGATDYATLMMWIVYLANSIWGYKHWTKLSKEGIK